MVFQVVAVAGTGWLMYNNEYLIEEGLFRVCAKSFNICTAFDYVKSKYVKVLD